MTCFRLNDAWDDNAKAIESEANECDEAINATFSIFGEEAFRRYSIDGVEGRFNRAIFDAMVFYFRHQDIRTAAISNSAAVVESFHNLCTDDQSFVEAITRTTKSIPATH